MVASKAWSLLLFTLVKVKLALNSRGPSSCLLSPGIKHHCLIMQLISALLTSVKGPKTSASLQYSFSLGAFHGNRSYNFINGFVDSEETATLPHQTLAVLHVPFIFSKPKADEILLHISKFVFQLEMYPWPQVCTKASIMLDFINHSWLFIPRQYHLYLLLNNKVTYDKITFSKPVEKVAPWVQCRCKSLFRFIFKAKFIK